MCEIDGLNEGKYEILSYARHKETSCVKSLRNLWLPASVACFHSNMPFSFLGRK